MEENSFHDNVKRLGVFHKKNITLPNLTGTQYVELVSWNKLGWGLTIAVILRAKQSLASPCLRTTGQVYAECFTERRRILKTEERRWSVVVARRAI